MAAAVEGWGLGSTGEGAGLWQAGPHALCIPVEVSDDHQSWAGTGGGLQGLRAEIPWGQSGV